MDDTFDSLQKVELAMYRAEHQKRYQAEINFLKEQVGAGFVCSNAAVQIVLSEAGAYYEMHDLPEEFGGAAGEYVQRRFLPEQEAIDCLLRCFEAIPVATARNTRNFSILVIYTRRGIIDRKNCFVFDYHPEYGNGQQTPKTVGAFQHGVMPLFFKVKIDADFAPGVLGMDRGMIFCMSNAGDRNLLVRIPFTGPAVHHLTDDIKAGQVQ